MEPGDPEALNRLADADASGRGFAKNVKDANGERLKGESAWRPANG